MVWFEVDLCKDRPSPSANAGVCLLFRSVSVCFTLLNSCLKRCSNALDVRISSSTVIKPLCLSLCYACCCVCVCVQGLDSFFVSVYLHSHGVLLERASRISITSNE